MPFHVINCNQFIHSSIETARLLYRKIANFNGKEIWLKKKLYLELADR